MHSYCRDIVDKALLLGLVKDVGEVALATVLAVVHGSHEDTSTALIFISKGPTSIKTHNETHGLLRAFPPQALDLAIAIDLVVLEDSELGLLPLVLDLLGCSVDLLLALLAATAEAEDEVQGRLLLDVVVGESTAVLELLAGEDQALLIWWDTLLVYMVIRSLVR
jgi:hypothetical protein